MWMELKREVCMQYPVIPSDNHATQVFTQLEQGPDELLDDFPHCASHLLSKLNNNFDMSSISVKGTHHYAVVYCLNFRNLKDSIMGDWNAQ